MAAADLPDPAFLAELGKKPISPDAPAGADASYEPEYESLQREIDKLAIVSEAGEAPDWKLAASLAATILSEKSKDLKVAAYLSEALTRTRQIDGMAQGTHVLRDMVETYWDGLFPTKKRMRGRMNALNWWLDKGKAFFASYEPDPLPPETVAALKDDLDALDKALAEKSDEAPPLFSLIESTGRLPVQEPEPAPEPQPSEEAARPGPDSTGSSGATGTGAPQTSAGQASSTGPAGSADQAREQLKSGLDLLFSASYALQKEDPKAPAPYRLVRLAAWLPLAGAPPAANGKTMIPPPPSNARTALEQALSANNYQAAIENAESKVLEFRFWLDLSRISAQGLRSLGEDYQAALDALETETALFVRRMPGVENLTFSDGTPFADEKTKLWLSGLGRAAGGGAGQPGAASGGEGSEVDGAMAKARELAAKNQAVSAVVLLQDKLGSAKSGRLRLTWRIGLAEILMASGSPESARPIIEQILSDMDEHKLDDFDPDLALKGLLTARQGLAAAKDEAAKTRARDILARIMRLNPAEGLRLSGVQ